MKYIAHYTDQESADIASYASTVFGLDSEPRSPADLPGYEEVRRGEFSDFVSRAEKNQTTKAEQN